MVAITIFIHDLGHDLLAKKSGFISEFKSWGIKRYGWSPQATFPKKVFGWKINILPIGLILAVLVTIFSNGQFWFAAVSSYGLVIEKISRFGKKFVNVTNYEDAKIAIAGPGAVLLLLLVLKIFNWSGIFDKFIFICSVLVIYDMLPIPGLDGWKVAMGSKPLYFFGFILTIGIIALVQLTGAIQALVISLIFSAILVTLYYYFSIYKS